MAAIAERTPLERRGARPAVEAESAEALSTPRDWSWVPFAILVLVAFVLRLYDLGARAMHHDESLHALYSWYLSVGRGYTHDPMMHGPFLFHATAFVYLLFGDSEVTARLPEALLGSATVVLPYFLRHELGRNGALAASALIAFGPSFVYFSRFAREDATVAFHALLLVVGMFGWMRTRRPAYLYAGAVGLALLFSNKEVSFIYGFIFATFLLLAALIDRAHSASLAYLRARLPAVAAFVAPVGVTGVLEALREIGWRRWAIAAGIFFGISTVLYTTFFTNLEGLCTALWSPPAGSCATKQGALQYWLAQHGVQRGSQPGFYYLLLIPLYETLTFALAIAALFLARRRSLFFWFCVWWALLSFVIYSWAGEKMPWLALHLMLPLVLLGAQAAERLTAALQLPWGLPPRQWAVGGLLLVAVGVFAAWLAGGGPTATAFEAQVVTLRRIALGGVIIALAALVVRAAGGLPRRQTLGAAAAAGLLLLVGYTVRTTWQLNYKNADTPVEMLVYVQSAPDVPFLVRELERIGNQLGTRRETSILLDGGYTEGDVVRESIAWPFEWYLREHKGKQYYSKNLPADFGSGRYAAVLAVAPNMEPIRDQLSGYTGNKFRLNWWYPEDYKQLTWNTPLQTLADPTGREKLFKYLLYRELINPPLGAREFYFYVRNDLVGRVGPGAPSDSRVSLPPAGPSTREEVEVREFVAYGRPGGVQALRDPKGIALAPDNRLYVVDATLNTVTVFDQDGLVARTWGRKGTGDGEFTEPWGIAVGPDGSVYVADTWNHRVQKFDSQGRFLTKWGTFADTRGQAAVSPASFFGPRDLAFTPNGELLVTDTGNERIQVFDQNGRYLRGYGGEGRGPGQFREPVGIAVDASGRIYVADTWNQRVQVFGPGFELITSYPIPGWTSESAAHKPYLTVSPEGEIFASVPERGGIVRVRGGSIATLSLSGSPRLGLPIGIKLDQAGRLFVSDAQGAVVVAHRLPSFGAPEEE